MIPQTRFGAASTVWPREFTLENYKVIFTFSGLLTGFKISVLRTLVGTLLGLISASMIAYTISRPDFQGRKFVSVFLALRCMSQED